MRLRLKFQKSVSIIREHESDEEVDDDSENEDK